MNYVVEWTELAVGELAAVWLAVPHQADLTQITDLIDRSLGLSPFRVGNPSGSTVHRVLEVPPLGLTFDIVEDDKKVIVQACWLVGPA